MKNIFFALMFVVGGIASADQQQQPQPPATETVEFDTCFSVLVCKMKTPQQSPTDMKDLDCDTTSVSMERMSVTLEPSRDKEGVLVGKLDLSKEADGYKHVGKVIVGKDTTKQTKNYGFMVEESFFKADEQMPSELDRTYGAIRVNLPSELNDIAFVGKVRMVDDKILVPVVGIAAAGTLQDMQIKSFRPNLF